MLSADDKYSTSQSNINIDMTKSDSEGHEFDQKKKPLNLMTSKIKIIPSSRQGQMNTDFLATVPGVLKIAEIFLSFLSFVLAICSDRNKTTSAWTEHISFQATILISILLVGYTCFPHLTINEEKTREGLIFVELLYYSMNTMAFFIAIWLMLHLSVTWTANGLGSAIIDSILCVALTVLFGIETLMKYREWQNENAPISRIVQENIKNHITKTYDDVHVLRFEEQSRNA